MFLSNGRIIEKISYDEVVNNEKLFSDLGIKLPFVLDLSKKLEFYGILDSTCKDIPDVVMRLWKKD